MKYLLLIASVFFMAYAHPVLAATTTPLTLNPITVTPVINTPLTAPLPKQGIQPKPVITAYSIGNCISPSSTFTIYGQNFGKRTGKRAVLGGHGISIPLKVMSWRKTIINVRLPNNSKLRQGLRYYTGIQKFSNHVWLSNINKSFLICSTNSRSATLTTSPQVLDRVQIPTLQNRPNNQITPTQRQLTVTPPQNSGGVIPAMTPVLLPPPSIPGNSTSNNNAQVPTPSALYSEEGSDGAYAGGDYGGYTSDNSGALIGNGPPVDFLPPSMDEAKASDEPDNIEPGEIMLASASMEEARALAQQATNIGLRIKSRKNLKSLAVVLSIFRTPQGMTSTQALSRFRQRFPKLWVDSNHRFSLQRGSAIRDYAQQMIHWPSHISSCASTARIGMLDTTIDTSIPALRTANILTKQLTGKKSIPAPSDHGTSIATLLVGQSIRDFRGLMPTAHLYAAEVFRQRDKRHIDATTEQILKGLDWLASKHVRVINLSFGGSRDMLLELAIGQLMQQGISVVAAAGNYGKSAAPVYPAAQQGVIAVTAVDIKSHPYSQANRGTYIDFSAPGVDVWIPNGSSGLFKSGTSYATPFVTAAISAIQTTHRDESMSNWIHQLQSSAIDLGKKGRDSTFGWGLIQTGIFCK